MAELLLDYRMPDPGQIRIVHNIMPPRLWITACLPALFLSGGAVALNSAEVNMVKLHVDSFWMIGLQTRTSNAREATSDGDIAKLWRRLYQDGIVSRIPNRTDSRVIAVYSDYETDKDGLYTYTLGAKVNSIDKLPNGLSAKKVVNGDYGMFTAANGPMPQLVVGLWKQIWSLEADPLHRAYQTDFEVYEEHQDPQNGRVDIYIGLRK
ncbi:MAG TPA: GyrI-like domain-containing protein [Bryobacteraceae bacterium]|nr:GyrI-like domain-containing protein [Bryobacteraceae bacterium]